MFLSNHNFYCGTFLLDDFFLYVPECIVLLWLLNISLLLL